MANDMQDARRVLRGVRDELLSRANVVGTGIGYKATGGSPTTTLSIVCSVVEKVPTSHLGAADLVPPTVNGIPTDVVATGRFRALQDRTGRHRPAPGGVSIGHKDITAGTLGCVVRRNGEPVILSNNHVLANSNEAAIGDSILQPGPFDGGTLPDDDIASLLEFVPVSFVGAPSDCPVATGAAGVLNGMAALLGRDTRLRPVRTRAAENLVDAAVARPHNPADVSAEILEIGPIQGTTAGELGMSVRKSGRTTGLTTGVIQQVDVSANVQFGAGRIALFTDQLMAGPMSQGGDSGSAVLDDHGNLVGLLFAGSDSTTLFNRIENVFDALGLEV